MFQYTLGLYRQVQRVCGSLLPEFWDSPLEATFQVCDPDAAAAGVRLSENLLSWFISYPSQVLISSHLGLTRATLRLRFPSMLTERDPLFRWKSEDAKKNGGEKALHNCVYLSGLQKAEGCSGVIEIPTS